MTEGISYAYVADVLDQLPDELQVIRRATGSSLRDVSEATGVSIASLSTIERRQKSPTLGNVIALLRWMSNPTQERKR